MAARPSRKKDDKGEGEPSIFDKLTEELQQRGEEEEFVGGEVTVLFCGPKGSGKTSIVDRFINPTKDEKDKPKPTVALDYKFARHDSKVLAHIYDLGVDLSSLGSSSLLAIPTSPNTVATLVCVVTVDLSEPHSVIPNLEGWLGTLREQLAKSLDTLSKESPIGARKAEALRKHRMNIYEKQPEAVQLFPVPLIIFAAKWDVFVAEVDSGKAKLLCRALRFIAYTCGAHLVCSSLKDKAALKSVRDLLRQLLFGVAPKGGVPDQMDSSRPLCVIAGKDNLQNIGAPGAGAATLSSWKAAVESTFLDARSGDKNAKKSEAEQLADELQKYSEESVDGMVQQRQNDLQLYRRQVERNQRLASEGVEVGKKGILES